MRLPLAIRFACPLLAVVLLGQAKASADLTAIVPAYFYPTTNSPWDDLTTAASRIPVTAIMNPGSGPGSSQDSNYVNAVDTFRTAGGKVIAYVYTSYGSRSSAQVKADIDKYVNWYNIDGIFFDEFSNASSTSTLNYYQDLYDYVKGINSTWEVMGNPGTNTVESYLTRPAADSLLVFENYGSSYTSYTPSAWNYNYDSSQIGHLIHTTSSEADMLTYLDLAVSRNAGQVYITDDVMNNPWDTLPSYWDAEVDRIEQINNGNIDPPPTGGTTLSNPVANGSIVVTTTDRSDWADIPAYDADGSETGGVEVDYETIQIAHDDTNFYFRMLLNSSVSLSYKHNVLIDVDFDRDTGFIGGAGQFAVGAEYLLQGSNVYEFTGSSQGAWSWNYLGTMSVNATPNTDIETLIPRSLIGNPDGFDFVLFADNATVDIDYYPNVDLDAFRYLIDMPLVGDLDGDGFVGLSDLDIVLSAWNQTVTAGDLAAGDPSGDGFVGLDDLDLILSNWNAGTAPTNSNNIPEPSTLLLLSAAGVATLCRR